ncbi:MAG TPA: glycosyltransferase family 4 protein [Thermodesulfobacteriota bacterium]
MDERPTKVLLCNTLYHPNVLGGAERSVQLLAESLVERGHAAVVVSLGRERARRTDEVRGVRVHYLPLRNLYWPFGGPAPAAARRALWHALDSYNPRMAAEVGAVLDEERPDLVHTHTIAGFSAAVWRAARQRGLPLVHTLRDQYLLCPRTTMFRNGRDCETPCLSCRAYAWPRRRLTAQVDVVTGVSRFILDRHLGRGYFTDARRAVVYNACRPPARPPDAPVGARPGPLRIGYLGRLHPSKGVDRLVQAFCSIEPGAAELWIAGTGRPDDEAALRAGAGTRADVRWLGFVEPEALLAAVDLLVVPSLWHDTAPRVVLEAFAHGVPVVGSTRGGIPELVAEGAGWLFDPDDPGALAAVLRRCIERRDRLAAVGAAARAHATRFSPEAVTAAYLEVYRRALEARRG